MDVSAELPRLAAWLRSEHPSATAAEIDVLLAGVAPERLHRLERVLDDLLERGAPG